MREIRFRAWIPENYPSAEYKLSGRKNEFVFDWQDTIYIESCGFNPGDGITIEQLTGLKDKNGTEIYEGDILNITGFVTAVGVVVYSAPSFVVRQERKYAFGDPFYDYDMNEKGKYNDGKVCFEYDKNLEVIGNIHENPELLETK